MGTRVEIDESALLRLIREGALSIHDFRCLDKEAKRFVWRSYLVSTRCGNDKTPHKRDPQRL